MMCDAHGAWIKTINVAFLLDFTLLQNAINRLNHSREAFRAKQTAHINDSATGANTIYFQCQQKLVYNIIKDTHIKKLEKLEIIFKRMFFSMFEAFHP